MSAGRTPLDPRQSKTAGRLLAGLAVLCALGFVLTGLAMVAGHFRNGGELGVATGAIFLVLAALTVWTHWDPIASLEYWLIRRSERHTLPLGREVLAGDPRPPVLYLRSFVHDRILAHEEEALDSVLGHVGPFIAIGMPGERLPPFGAARFYVANDNWQDFIKDFLDRASLVVIAAGATAGVGWELEQCRARLDPGRLVVLVPKLRNDYEVFRSRAKAAVQLFLPETAAVYRRAQWRGGNWIGFISFGLDWRAEFTPFPRGGRAVASAPDYKVDRLAGLYREGFDAYSQRQGFLIPAPVSPSRTATILYLLNGLLTVVGIIVALMYLTS